MSAAGRPVPGATLAVARIHFRRSSPASNSGTSSRPSSTRQTRSASTAAATSWTRTIAAPAATPCSTAASVPARRSSRRAAGDRADEVLARDGQQDRPAERVQARQARAAPRRSPAGVLAKSGPGSSSDLLGRHAALDGERDALAQERARRRPPRRRRSGRSRTCLGSARVCMTTSAAPLRAATSASSGSRRPLTSLRIAAPAATAARRDLRLPGVDRDEHALGGEPLDQRHDALDLDLLGRDAGVGDAGLAADVDQVGALGDELAARARPGARACRGARCPRTSRGSR